MLAARELWAVVQRQATSHGVTITDPIRGMLANVLQVALGEWAWEHEELVRLRGFHERCMIAVGDNALTARIYTELADLERFYAARAAVADSDG